VLVLVLVLVVTYPHRFHAEASLQCL